MAIKQTAQDKKINRKNKKPLTGLPDNAGAKKEKNLISRDLLGDDIFREELFLKWIVMSSYPSSARRVKIKNKKK